MDINKLRVGQLVKANVAYKYVPHVQRKVQLVRITMIDKESDILEGKTEKGKIVHFAPKDIQI